MRVAAGTDYDSVQISVIAFGRAGEQLAVRTEGDSLAPVGRAKPKTFSKDGAPKAGFDAAVDHLLTAYHLKSKRATTSNLMTPPRFI